MRLRNRVLWRFGGNEEYYIECWKNPKTDKLNWPESVWFGLLCYSYGMFLGLTVCLAGLRVCWLVSCDKFRTWFSLLQGLTRPRGDGGHQRICVSHFWKEIIYFIARITHSSKRWCHLVLGCICIVIESHDNKNRPLFSPELLSKSWWRKLREEPPL